MHFAVYRDAEALLPWLDMHELSLPRADQVSGYGRCFAARCPVVGEFISHADCWRNSALLDFEALTGAQYAGLVHVMSCWGLLTSYDPPAHLQSYAQIENSLERLRLLSDLTRGTFYLWISWQTCHCPGRQSQLSGCTGPTTISAFLSVLGSPLGPWERAV